MVKRPEEEGFPEAQTIRKYPATIGLSPKQRDSLEDLAERYMKFMHKAITPTSVVDEVISMASKKGYFNEPNKNKPYYLLGPDEKSFVLVKPGNYENLKDPLEKGLKIISSHTDSPCLIAKQRPLFFEWDPDEKELYPGVMFDMYPYGGIQPYHWEGIPVKLIGSGVLNKKRYEKTLDGYILGQSAHLDRRDHDTPMGEGFTQDNIKVFTGHSSRKEVLKELGFKSEDDFFTIQWFAVPRINPLRIGDFLCAYGHDNRSGTFGAIDAILKSTQKKHTSAVIGFDYEETGSEGAGGARGKFLDYVIETIMEKSGTKLSKSKLLRISQGISADTDIAPGPHENSEKGIIDKRNITRLGYGVSIPSASTGLYECNNVPLDFKNYIKELVEKKNITAQFLGAGVPADNAFGAETVGYFLTNKGLYNIDAGPAVASSHGLSEMIHAGDLFWTREFYKAFLEDTREYKQVRKSR